MIRRPPAIGARSYDDYYERGIIVTRLLSILLRCYREGADLKAKLPVLATYLGHQSLTGTQRYLHLTGLVVSGDHRAHQRRVRG